MIAILINTLSMGIEYHEQVCLCMHVHEQCARLSQTACENSLIETGCANHCVRVCVWRGTGGAVIKMYPPIVIYCTGFCDHKVCVLEFLRDRVGVCVHVCCACTCGEEVEKLIRPEVLIKA